MAYEACPNPQEGCPHYSRPTKPPLQGLQEHGCFSDQDHILPQRLGRLITATQVQIDYINSDANIKQECRWQHEAKTRNENDEELLIQLERVTTNDEEQAA